MLADEIATFAARIDVAEHALITRLRMLDAHEAWGPLGFHSCAHWLSSAATGHDLEELDQFLREADLHIDASTISNNWDGTHVAITEILDWMFIAEQTRGSGPRPLI